MISQLPFELVVLVLQNCEPLALCALRATCKVFKEYIDTDLSLSYWQGRLRSLFVKARNGVQQVGILAAQHAIARLAPSQEVWPLEAKGRVCVSILENDRHLCGIDLRLWKMPPFSLSLLTSVVSLTVHIDVDGKQLPPNLRCLRLRFGAHATSLPHGLQILCMELRPGRILPVDYFPTTLRELHISNYCGGIAGPVSAPHKLCRLVLKNVASAG